MILVSDFPTIKEVVRETSDFTLSPAEAIVQIRLYQVVEAVNLGLQMDSTGNVQLWDEIRMAITTAYQLGLRDGMVPLGELV